MVGCLHHCNKMNKLDPLATLTLRAMGLNKVK